MANKSSYDFDGLGKKNFKIEYEKENFNIKQKLETLIYGYIKIPGLRKRGLTTTLCESEMTSFAQPGTTPEAVPEATAFQPKQTELKEFIDEFPDEEQNCEPTYATYEDVKTIFERVLTKTKEKTTSDGH